MARKELDHLSSNEWTGLFWFPESEEQKFSGTVNYTLESGIKIKLLTTDHECEDNINKKVLHGAITGEVTNSITLLNITLNLSVMTTGQTSVRVLSGNAGYLLQGILVDEPIFDEIELQYEEQFENIFFSSFSKEKQIIAYQDTKIKPDDDITISISINSHGTHVYSADDIDTIFWSHNEPKFNRLKTAFNELFEDSSFDLFKRNYLAPTFKIQKPNSSLHDLFTVEEKWRAFWELLIDEELLPSKIWVRVPYQLTDDNTVYNELIPLLRSYYMPLRKKKKTPLILHQLPLNITSFAGVKNDLSIVNEALSKWFVMKGDSTWIPVSYGITRILKRKHRLAETPHFVSLISEVETFLNLLNKFPENVDTLIEDYATQEWKDQVSTFLPLKSKETLGIFLTDMRNSIVHPKGASQRYKRQLSLVKDLELFQKSYAYLAGLFVKAVLLEFKEVSLENIEEFTQKFIKARGSWETIEYS